MQVFPTVHSLKLHIDPQEKLQNLTNFRKTHYSMMRFNKAKNDKQLFFYQMKHLQNASFPVVVNNKLCAFRSQKSVKFIDDEYDFDAKQKAYNSKNRHARKKIIREFRHQNIQNKHFDSMPDTIKINKISLNIKQIDHFHKTQIGFKNFTTLQRKNSLTIYSQRQKEKKASKSLKKQTICGWETGLPELYL